MTDRERHETDGRLQAQYAQARADYSRRRQEAQELGKYLRDFGQALINRPEHIAIAPAAGVFKDQDWFFVTLELPTLHQVNGLVLDLRELAETVRQSADDLKARGLPL